MQCCIFLKKTTKNTCGYHYQNLNDTIYSSWDIEQNKLKLVILDHFLPFIPLKTPKIKILKSEKISWRYHFTHTHQKSQSYIRFLRYGVRQTKCFVILGHFLPFYSAPPSTSQPPSLIIPSIKILKKNAWRYYPFIHTCVP